MSPREIELSEEDLMEALRQMHTYIDITPEDLKTIYKHAFKHAREKILHTRAAEIMNTDIITLTPDTHIEKAAEILTEHHISGAPVVEKDTVVGVLSETDILKAITGKQKPGILELLKHKTTPEMPEIHVKDVMTTPPITTTPDTPLHKIIDLLTLKKINRLPVVNEDNKPLGIITRTDILQLQAKVVIP